MSSYNFLRAVSDGLAEAIRYRTNLKRQRRENEYNYQLDLRRKRDEEAYNRQRDLQWDEEDYNIKQNREEEKTNKRIQKNLDFLDGFYHGKELNTPQQIQDFNFEAIARERPFSVALPKKDNFAQQIALEDLRQKNRIALQQMKNAARGGSVRQPSLTPYEKLQRDLSMAKTPEEREMVLQLHRVGSRAVKGSGSKSVAVGGSGYGKEAENALNDYYKMVGELADAQSKASGKGNVDSVQKILDINPELPEEQRALLEGTIQTDQAHQNRQLADSLKNYRDRVEIARQRANEYLKPYGRMINQNGQMIDINQATLAASQKNKKVRETLNQEHDNLIGLNNQSRAVASLTDTPPKAVMSYPPTILPSIEPTPEDTPRSLAEKYLNYELNLLNQNRANMADEQYLSELKKLYQKYGRR